MNTSNKSGYALIAVLTISFTLFSLLSLAISTNYRFHQTNRRSATALQQRADKLSASRQ